MLKSENSQVKYLIEEKKYELNYIFKFIDKISSDKLDLLKNDGICIQNSSQELIFKFVGVICIDDNIIIVLPKYYMPLESGETYLENDIFDSTVKILKVLRRYPRNKAKQFLGEFFLNDNIESMDTSEIYLADYIIRDFMENGIYDNKFYQLDLNSHGEIDWGYTIDNIHPYISESGPIYGDTYNYKYYDDTENKIIYIHKCILNELIGKYSKLLGYNLCEVDSRYTDLSQIGSNEELLNIIDKELHRTFIQSKIDILKCMYNIISRDYNGNQQGKYNVFGTKSFEHVWEYVVGEVFLNEKLKFIGDTNNLKDEEDDYKDQNNIMDRPIWLDNEGKPNINNKKTLNPDFIKVEENILFILDAKYYNVEYQYKTNKNGEKELIVRGNPGIDSVTKQFLYEKILEKRIPEKYSNMHIKTNFNGFIYPSRFNIDNLSCKFGKVKLDIFGKHVIHNIYIDAEKLYELYLNNDSCLCKTLIES